MHYRLSGKSTYLLKAFGREMSTLPMLLYKYITTADLLLYKVFKVVAWQTSG